VRPIQFEANWLVVMLLCRHISCSRSDQPAAPAPAFPSGNARPGNRSYSGNLPRIGANADGLAEEAFLLNQWLTGAVILVRTLEVVYYQTCSAFPTSTDTV
jgi:hypothetical protein